MACVLWGPAKVGVVFAMVSVVVTFAYIISVDDHGELRRWGTWRRIGRIVVCASTVLVSISLAGQPAPVLGLLTAAAWAATTPPVWGWLERRAGLAGAGTSYGEEPVTTPCRSAAAALSDEDLCRAWVRTSEDLASTRDPGRRLAIVITRQHLLDEVWTRDRRALEHWVQCGARAADHGSPRYFDPS